MEPPQEMKLSESIKYYVDHSFGNGSPFAMTFHLSKYWFYEYTRQYDAGQLSRLNFLIKKACIRKKIYYETGIKRPAGLGLELFK